MAGESRTVAKPKGNASENVAALVQHAAQRNLQREENEDAANEILNAARGAVPEHAAIDIERLGKRRRVG